MVRAFKKEFACNGTVVDHAEYGEVIQLQGDQRNNVCLFLTKIGIAKEDQLKVRIKIQIYFLSLYLSVIDCHLLFSLDSRFLSLNYKHQNIFAKLILLNKRTIFIYISRI